MDSKTTFVTVNQISDWLLEKNPDNSKTTFVTVNHANTSLSNL